MSNEFYSAGAPVGVQMSLQFLMQASVGYLRDYHYPLAAVGFITSVDRHPYIDSLIRSASPGVYEISGKGYATGEGWSWYYAVGQFDIYTSGTLEIKEDSTWSYTGKINSGYDLIDYDKKPDGTRGVIGEAATTFGRALAGTNAFNLYMDGELPIQFSGSRPTGPTEPTQPTEPYPPTQPPEPRDPLVLDLDNDGVELISLSTSSAYFDYNLDGFREKTGWLSPDDGFLVNDGNSNGIVDDISELFGNEYEDGFVALARFDTNKDGIISILDNGFHKIKIWQDLNSNGLSDSGELTSLELVGVKSVGLSHTSEGYVSQGNTIANSGEFNYLDGSFGIAQTVLFTVNRTITSWIPPEGFNSSEESLKLPTLKGYGQLTDFQYALTLNNDLLSAVQNFIVGAFDSSTNEILSDFEYLMYQWAGINEGDTGQYGLIIDSRKILFLEKFFGSNIVESETEVSIRFADLLAESFQSLIDSMLTRFFSQIAGPALHLGVSPDTIMSSVFFPLITLDYDRLQDKFSGSGQSAIEWVLSEVKTDVANPFERAKLAAVSILGLSHEYFNSNKRSIAEFVFEKSKLHGIDNGLIEIITAVLSEGKLVDGDQGQNILNGSIWIDVFDGKLGDDTFYGESGSDVYLYSTGDGNDKIVESADSFGVDKLVLGAGLNAADVFVTRSSTDDAVLSFVGKSDLITLDKQFSAGYLIGIEQIVFGDGTVWDRAQVEAAYIAQVQSAGDDRILGFSGSTTFAIQALAGNDTIVEGRSTFDVDKVAFGLGLNASDVRITRSNTDTDDAILSFVGKAGSITLDDQFYSGSLRGIEQVVFGDGTVWDRAEMEAAYIAQMQSAGDDRILGFGGSTTFAIQAVAGNDTIIERQSTSEIDKVVFGLGLNASDLRITRSNTDTDDAVLSFVGKTGSITLDDQFYSSTTFGPMGIEQVVFGDGTVWDRAQLQAAYLTQAQTVGDDRIIGFGGSTTFAIQALAGNDTIAEGQSTSEVDKLVLGSGLNASDIRITRSSTDANDAVLSFVGKTGSITLDNQFYEGYPIGIEQIVFADGTIWNRTQMQVAYIAQAQTAGDDRILGFGGSTTFAVQALAGNDTIAEGQSTSEVDKLVLGSGLNASDIRITRSSTDANDAVLSFVGKTGSITLDNQFYEGYPIGIEQIVFADGTIWNRTQMQVAYIAQAQTAGDDRILGFGGSTTFAVQALAGNDTIAEGQSTSEVDKLVLGSGLNASDIRITRSSTDANDAVLSFVGKTGSITLDNQFYEGYPIGIEQIVFADGTIWNRAAILAAVTSASGVINGTSSADTLTGTSGADTINGLDGNDTLKGLAGADVLDGGAGTDTADYSDKTTAVVATLNGATNASITVGGTAEDTIRNIESLTGGSANDTLTGDSLANTLSGGTGDDLLTGSTGSDIYVYNAGDGVDTIVDGAGASDSDKLVLGAGILPADVVVTRSTTDTDDAILTFTGRTGSIILDEQFSTVTGSLGVEQIGFANGTTWDRAAILAAVASASGVINGTSSADTLMGTSGADTINGLDGNDTLKGLAGADVLDGGAGTDTADYSDKTTAVVATLNGATNASITVGGTAEDTIRNIESLTGGSANDTLTGDSLANTLTGGAGNDTLNGGAGDDILIGGVGADVINGGDGFDYISFAGSSAGIDAYLWDDGVGGDAQGDVYTNIEGVIGSAFADRMFGQDHVGETFKGGAGNDELNGFGGDDTLEGEAGADVLDGGAGTDTADYSDKTTAVVATLNGATNASITVGGTAEDTIRNIESLTGGSANDTLTGDSLANTLSGGTGDDLLTGSTGSDIYVYNAGDGVDTIVDGAGASDSDKLVLGAGILPADVVVTRSTTDTDDAILTFTGRTGSIILDEQFSTVTGSLGVEQIGFANGTTWDRAAILAAVASASGVINGTSSADTLTGTSGADTINGLDGNDTLKGLAGADVLDGGAGTDTADYSDKTTAVVATLNGATNASITVGGTAEDTIRNIESLTGGSANDTLTGDSLANTLTGGAGNDTLNGGAGDDILIGGVGADVINGGDGFDYISFAGSSAGIDAYLWDDGVGGDAQGDVYTNIEGVIGSAFADRMFGQDHVGETFKGGAGNDELNGFGGDDTLEGQAGDDTLIGGNGSDTFDFHASFGKDAISDFVAGAGSVDVIEFDVSIFATYAALAAAATQSGADTLITVDASNTLTLKNVSVSSLHSDDFRFV